MRIRRSGLREDGLEMLTARRRIVLQSIGPLLQLDFPPSDVAPLPAWGILAARGRYARPASLYPSIFRVGPRSSKLAAPTASEPSLSHNNVPRLIDHGNLTEPSPGEERGRGSSKHFDAVSM